MSWKSCILTNIAITLTWHWVADEMGWRKANRSCGISYSLIIKVQHIIPPFQYKVSWMTLSRLFCRPIPNSPIDSYEIVSYREAKVLSGFPKTFPRLIKSWFRLPKKPKNFITQRPARKFAIITVLGLYSRHSKLWLFQDYDPTFVRLPKKMLSFF